MYIYIYRDTHARRVLQYGTFFKALAMATHVNSPSKLVPAQSSPNIYHIIPAKGPCKGAFRALSPSEKWRTAGSRCPGRAQLASAEAALEHAGEAGQGWRELLRRPQRSLGSQHVCVHNVYIYGYNVYSWMYVCMCIYMSIFICTEKDMYTHIYAYIYRYISIYSI